MSETAGNQLEELDLVERCLAGGPEAIAAVKSQNTPYIEAILRTYGASADEAEEILASLWRDCLIGRPPKEPLFVRYNGLSALRKWLGAIAVNRWISLKRAQSARERAHERAMEHETLFHDSITPDPELSGILEQAIREAMLLCSAEEVVFFRLIYLHELTQKEVAGLFGMTESTLSRCLKKAEGMLSREILRRVRAADEHLDVCWDDFLVLCDSVALLRAA